MKTSQTREAHDRDSSTFTKHCAGCIRDKFEANEPDNLWHVDQQWTDHNAGNFALDRDRRKLPNDPAFVSQAVTLVTNPMDLFYEPILSNSA